MRSQSYTRINNGKLVLPNQILSEPLIIDPAGKIHSIGKSIPEPPEITTIDAKGTYILPGFIDIHTHGANGFDASLGNYQVSSNSFDASSEGFQLGIHQALAFYASQGVTRVFPTTLAASLDDLEFAFQQFATYLSQETAPYKELIGGFNLEGTFLKLPEYAGAQNPEFFYPASQETFDLLHTASGERISIVNVPPEHGAIGMELIKYLTDKGITVAGGHTGAEADTFYEAIDAGLRLAVHFFNGPSRSSSKSFHDGGAMEAMLRSDKMSLELIVDGYHVHPAYVRDAIARKELERIILITDSMFATGQSDIHAFSLGGIPGVVSENRSYLQVVDKADTLFGSVLTSVKGVENVLNWLTQDMQGIWYRQHPAYSLEEALVQLSHMASLNPARLLHLQDKTGSLEEGKWADFVMVDIHKKNDRYQITPVSTWVQGKPLFNHR